MDFDWIYRKSNLKGQCTKTVISDNIWLLIIEKLTHTTNVALLAFTEHTSLIFS